MQEFEFDPQKSASNLKKHGINFVDAQELWTDPNLIELAARVEDEPRFLAIGMIGPKHWSALITYRNASVRVISVRRPRDEEILLYES